MHMHTDKPFTAYIGIDWWHMIRPAVTHSWVAGHILRSAINERSERCLRLCSKQRSHKFIFSNDNEGHIRECLCGPLPLPARP